MNALPKQSRSILANRLNQFATLYDPDAVVDALADEAIEPDSDFKPLRISCGHAKYSNYRKTRIRTDPHCFYCGREVTIDTGTLDHIIPESRGGTDHPANLFLTCATCNTSKGDATPKEWHVELLAKLETLTALANNVQERINEYGLDWYKPTCGRQQGKKGKAGQPTEPTDPDEMNVAQFQTGKRRYSILCTATGRTLLRNLNWTQAIHYLKGTNQGDAVQLVSMEPLYNADLGLSKKDFR